MHNSINEMNLKNCVKCGSLAAMMCQRCFDPYCSVECQVTDWRDHKLNCVEMPQLVSMDILGTLQAKSLKNVHAKTPQRSSTIRMNNLNNKCSYDVFENIGNALPETWRGIMKPPKTGYFEALVQFVELSNDSTTTKVWFTDTQHLSTLQSLLEQLQRQVRFNEPIKVNQHVIGTLVVANCSERPYRAEIISLQPQTKQITLRLIDRGTSTTLMYDQVFAPTPTMASLPAFAFGAIICPPYNEPIERYSTMKIQLCSNALTTDGYYKVEINMSKPQSQMATMTKHPGVKLLKVLDGQAHFVLLQQFNKTQSYASQSKKLQETASIPTSKAMQPGEIVAACIEGTWHRALLLAFALVDNVHLVYLFDEGRVTYSRQINELETELAKDLPRVLILQLEKTLPDPVKNSAVVLMISGKQPNDNVMLHVGDFVSKAKLVAPLSLFDEAKYGYWREKPTTNSIVRITETITHAELCVTAGDLALTGKILTSLAGTCEPVKNDHVIQKNDFVLAEYAANIYMRGIIIGTNENKCKLLDVDTGIIRTAPCNKLRHATQLLCALPSQVVNIKLDLLSDIPKVPTDSSGLKYLRGCIDQKIEFKLIFEDENSSVATLLSCNKPYSSLNKQILPLMFQVDEPSLPDNLSQMDLQDKSENCSSPTAKSTTKFLAVPKPLSPETVARNEKKSIASNDVANVRPNENKSIVDAPLKKAVPISALPEGDGVELFVIDSSAFDRKILTVANFDGGKIVQEFNRTLELTLNVVKNATPEQKEYPLRVNELCLAIFKDDGEWYRARCLKVLADNNYMVEFFDYGNCSEVAQKDIIAPLPEELCYPQFTHNCELRGDYDVAALQKALTERPLLTCNVAKVGDKYWITPKK